MIFWLNFKIVLLGLGMSIMPLKLRRFLRRLNVFGIERKSDGPNAQGLNSFT